VSSIKSDRILGVSVAQHRPKLTGYRSSSRSSLENTSFAAGKEVVFAEGGYRHGRKPNPSFRLVLNPVKGSVQGDLGLKYALRRSDVVNPHFDLTTLRVFTAVATLGSISRAASSEHIAVSAVSKRISDLEATLGAPLLQRSPRGVEPTAAGSALLHHAITILRSVQQLEFELGEYKRGIKGHIRIMVNKSSIVEGLPDDLGRFAEQHPDIKMDLREENSAAIVRAVLDGSADLGVFTAGLEVPAGIDTYLYRKDRLALIVPEGHPLAAQAQARLIDAIEHDFVGLDIESAWNSLLTEKAAELGRPLRLRFRVASFDAVCQMIRAKLGITLAPPAVLRAFTSAAGLLAVHFDESWAERELRICVRSSGNLPGSARLLLRHLIERLDGETG
jgi:DNA-binding transcriptional LysR family regulator